VAFCGRERLSLMVNEEDHVRVQVIAGGLQLEAAWREADAADDVLADTVPIAFDSRFGYLTVCPSNCGTGMRASAMLHLPALVMRREVERVIELAGEHQLVVRGLYGEGTHASGDLYQLSNQASLGLTERDILRQVNTAVTTAIEWERNARARLREDHDAEMQDLVGRALDLLRTAAAISSEEALHLLSQLRMGARMGLRTDIDPASIDELLLLTLPAHLRTMGGRELGGLAWDEVRASYLHERLADN
jgi:protein arginine kinase